MSLFFAKVISGSTAVFTRAFWLVSIRAIRVYSKGCAYETVQCRNQIAFVHSPTFGPRQNLP
jgi:hypothetical protein